MMETLQKRFLIFVLFAIPGLLQAQITINSSEIDITFGKTFNQYSVVDLIGTGIPVNVGNAGGPNTWTFNETLFPNPEEYVVTIVDPATTPFAASFPNSNHVWFSTIDDSGDVYWYLNKNVANLQLNGVAVVTADTSLILEENDPAVAYLPFPTQMGTSWTNNTTSSFIISGFGFFDSSAAALQVDAWGTVVTPSGSYDALRVREDVTNFTTIIFNGQVVSRDTTEEINFAWFAKDIGFIAEITGRENDTNPNYTLADQVGWRTTTPSAIGDIPGTVVTGFVLQQNFPNPFNPATKIRFQLKKATEVLLDVYTVTGQKVATLVDNRMPIGLHEVTFDARDLPSGVYFYRLKAAGQEAVRQMTLLR